MKEKEKVAYYALKVYQYQLQTIKGKENQKLEEIIEKNWWKVYNRLPSLCIAA